MREYKEDEKMENCCLLYEWKRHDIKFKIEKWTFVN